jgi:hypothetical protein
MLAIGLSCGLALGYLALQVSEQGEGVGLANEVVLGIAAIAVTAWIARVSPSLPQGVGFDDLSRLFSTHPRQKPPAIPRMPNSMGGLLDWDESSDGSNDPEGVTAKVCHV